MTTTFSMFRHPRLWVCLILGYASGMPLFLSDATLKAWYSEAGVNIITIGYLSLVGLPYTLKFLWAPVLDRFFPPFAGRRRGWIVLFQLGLIGLLIAMAIQQPQKQPILLATLAFLLAFCSASQDIVVDAYRTELLPDAERGMGAAFALGGYRIGMLVAGGLALIMADYWGWQWTYISLGLSLSVTILATWFAPEPKLPTKLPQSLSAAIREPIRELYQRRDMLWLLVFLILFKLGDAFTASLTPTFLLRELQFSLTEVGTATKIFGMVAAILGIFIGGFVLTRLGLMRSLLLCCILQALANLQFYCLALVGHNLYFMYATLFIENLFVGMGNAAIVAFIMALCDKRFTATQFAFFSAIAAFARVAAGPLSGYMVADLGWATFYLLTFFIALPAVFVLWRLRQRSVFYEQPEAVVNT